MKSYTPTEAELIEWGEAQLPDLLKWLTHIRDNFWPRNQTITFQIDNQGEPDLSLLLQGSSFSIDLGITEIKRIGYENYKVPAWVISYWTSTGGSYDLPPDMDYSVVSVHRSGIMAARHVFEAIFSRQLENELDRI